MIGMRNDYDAKDFEKFIGRVMKVLNDGMIEDDSYEDNVAIVSEQVIERLGHSQEEVNDTVDYIVGSDATWDNEEWQIINKGLLDEKLGELYFGTLRRYGIDIIGGVEKVKDVLSKLSFGDSGRFKNGHGDVMTAYDYLHDKSDEEVDIWIGETTAILDGCNLNADEYNLLSGVARARVATGECKKFVTSAIIDASLWDFVEVLALIRQYTDSGATNLFTWLSDKKFIQFFTDAKAAVEAASKIKKFGSDGRE